MKRLIVLFVFALAVGACGSADDVSPAPATATPSEAAPGTTGSADDGSTDALTESPMTTGQEGAPPSTAPQAAFDGPPAPDFSLTLADGTAFMLSEEARPVYLVFWAEW